MIDIYYIEFLKCESCMNLRKFGINIMNENVLYTMHAVCVSHRLTEDVIAEMVSWGIAAPAGNKPEKWLFSQLDYDRIGCATRFREELEINIPGAALALELLDELDKIRNSVSH